MVVGLTLLVAFLVIGVTTPVPFVAIGRGPTRDTLGQVDGTDVVAIMNLRTYPTTGHLNMTTVSVADRLTMAEAIRRWASGDFQLVPRDAVFPPGESQEQVADKNRKLFVDSQANAEAAALDHLGLPTDVIVGMLTDGSPSTGVLEVGDRLLEVGGRPVLGLDALFAALADTRPGQQVMIRFQRGDSPPRAAAVTLGAKPDATHGMLGVAPVVAPPAADGIVISLGDIGGPSAGLMFSLAVVDKLTPGALTGGRFVAGTGTIGFDGVVGAIDGIPHKMLAAAEAGATVFLVPARNCEEALATAPAALQLVKVDDLAGAVAGLETLTGGGTPAGC